MYCAQPHARVVSLSPFSGLLVQSRAKSSHAHPTQNAKPQNKNGDAFTRYMSRVCSLQEPALSAHFAPSALKYARANRGSVSAPALHGAADHHGVYDKLKHSFISHLLRCLTAPHPRKQAGPAYHTLQGERQCENASRAAQQQQQPQTSQQMPRVAGRGTCRRLKHVTRWWTQSHIEEVLLHPSLHARERESEVELRDV
jgi:hypothetical protein